jgi:IS605 OrfB family transposase
MVVDYCITNDIGQLIVGDLKVKKVINKENKVINGLSKSTGVSRFKYFLDYKSKKSGIEFILVNEYNTTKMNCLTGLAEFNSDVKNRKFNYNSIEIDRDINSCINILTKSGKCLTQESKRILLLNKMSKFKIY